MMRVAPLAALVALPAPIIKITVRPRSLHLLCVLRLNSCGDLSEVFCRIDQSALLLSAKLICVLAFKEVCGRYGGWSCALPFIFTAFENACGMVFEAFLQVNLQAFTLLKSFRRHQGLVVVLVGVLCRRYLHMEVYLGTSSSLVQLRMWNVRGWVRSTLSVIIASQTFLNANGLTLCY